MSKRLLILTGSERDYEKVREGLELLEELGVPFVFDVASAHRNPEKVIGYAKAAAEEGFGVIICCAGLSAHLPGFVAAHTSLPVIGVPLSSGPLSGFDSLLSMVQMPKGVPVATVGIDNITNACILALQILAQADEQIRERLKVYRAKMTLQGSTIRKENP